MDKTLERNRPTRGEEETVPSLPRNQGTYHIYRGRDPLGPRSSRGFHLILMQKLS